MAYSPKNLAVYMAAFVGAAQGVAIRDYAWLRHLPEPLARAFDQAWDGPASDVEVEQIQYWAQKHVEALPKGLFDGSKQTVAARLGDPETWRSACDDFAEVLKAAAKMNRGT